MQLIPAAFFVSKMLLGFTFTKKYAGRKHS